MNVKCDSCEWSLEIQLQHRRLPNGDGVDLHYFTCPNCSREYPTHYTDRSIRERQASVARLWERFHKTKDIQKREGIHGRILTIQPVISAEMDALKARMQESS